MVAKATDPATQSSPPLRDVGARVPATRGFAWVREGWQLFRDDPGTWIAAGVLHLAALGVMASTGLGMIFEPAVRAGSLTLARGLVQDGEAKLEHMFAPLQTALGRLTLLGAVAYALLLFLTFVSTVGSVAVAVWSGFWGKFWSVNEVGTVEITPMDVAPAGIVLTIGVVSLALFNAAYWFAPGLAMNSETSVSGSLGRSLRAFLRNWTAFFVFGLVVVVLAVVATIPLGLGWLVLGPVLMASYARCFADVFELSED